MPKISPFKRSTKFWEAQAELNCGAKDNAYYEMKRYLDLQSSGLSLS